MSFSLSPNIRQLLASRTNESFAKILSDDRKSLIPWLATKLSPCPLKWKSAWSPESRAAHLNVQCFSLAQSRSIFLARARYRWSLTLCEFLHGNKAVRLVSVDKRRSVFAVPHHAIRLKVRRERHRRYVDKHVSRRYVGRAHARPSRFRGATYDFLRYANPSWSIVSPRVGEREA